MDLLFKSEALSSEDWEGLEKDIQSKWSAEFFSKNVNRIIDQYGECAEDRQKVILMKGLSILLRISCHRASHPLDSEVLLLLAMFFDDLTTITDCSLLEYFCASILSLFTLALPLWYRQAPQPASEEERETIASLEEVLNSLRSMMGKRLTTTVATLGTPALQTTVLRCLGDLFRVFWSHMDKSGVESREKTKELFTTLIEPLQVVQEAHKASSARKISPVVIASLLNEMEGILWHLNPPTDEGTDTTVNSELFHDLVGKLLAVLLQYITDQQHRRIDAESKEPGSDVFHAYTVQWSLQRLLNTALFVFRQLSGDKESEEVSSLKNGLVSSINALGGVITIPTLPESSDSATAATASEQTLPWKEEWTRKCTSVVAVKDANTAEIGNQEDLDGLDENALLLLGGETTNLLKTPFGLVSPTVLVEMVIHSISQLPQGIKVEAIRQHHMVGLQSMQYQAAKRAQREEYERTKLIEREGIESFTPSELITQVKDTGSVYLQGMQMLRRPSTRTQFQKRAFLSVLQSYPNLKGEGEARIRATQALVARCLVQLPSTLLDSCVDQVFLRLHEELHGIQSTASNRTEVLAAVGRVDTYYQLLLQILFMSFASLAPFDGRVANLFLDLDEGAANSAAASLQFTVDAEVDIDDPVAFIQSRDVTEPCYAGKKRTREGEAIPSTENFSFYNDTKSSPSYYSYILCRMLEVVCEHRVLDLLLDIFTQVPGIPRYVWNYLYKQFCLSSQQERCKIGVVLLKHLAVHREVYRMCAVNILVQLSVSTNQIAMRYSILMISELLQTKRSGNKGYIIDKESEMLLLNYAKKHMSVIPLYEPVKKDSNGELFSEEQLMDDASEKCNRHFGLFLMLCVRNPRELFVALMETYVQCIQKNNRLMAAVLPENLDIKRMVQRLFKTNPKGFVTSLMPILVRYSKEAPLLVQSMLWSIRDTLNEPFPDVVKVVSVILENTKTMYRNAEIKAGVYTVNDIRFIAPFLSFLPAEEIGKTYLVSFLYFVQVQLQFKSNKASLPIQAQSYVLSPEELDVFIRKVIKEIVVKCPVAFDDKVKRGMSSYEWLAYLHRKPQEIALASAAAGSDVATPPISALTVRTIIKVCFSLTKTFSDATTEKLYDPATVERAVRAIVSLNPVPTQLMATVIIATDMFVKMNYTDFVRIMVQSVLIPLVRSAVYDWDEGLWKGVLLFCENYYRECSVFLMELPDTVLTKALRGREKLRELFTEEHGNNATFARILGNL